MRGVEDLGFAVGGVFGVEDEAVVAIAGGGSTFAVATGGVDGVPVWCWWIISARMSEQASAAVAAPKICGSVNQPRPGVSTRTGAAVSAGSARCVRKTT